MADILKVTTPLVNKNQQVAPKPGAEPPVNAFPLQSSTRVVPTHNQSELLKQNTSLLEEREGATILMNLLKDPSVTASYLKNIYLLEEVFKLLPAANNTVTSEIEQMFQSLVLDSGGLADEMVRQENDSTMFKGEIFDFLRELSDGNISKPEVQRGVANFLKALNNIMCKDDILDAVANNLEFLAKSLAASPELSGRLVELAEQFRWENANQAFPDLKDATLAILRDVADSILFSPKMSKILSIAIYNLSRYNNSGEFLNEAAFYLRQMLTGPQRLQLASLLEQFQRGLQSSVNVRTQRHENQEREGSKIMDILTKLIGQESGKESQSVTDEGKLDTILHSLLSSPCNFTPLLHFVVPAFMDNIRAFAEIWINPESDEKDMLPGTGSGKHFLLVIDVEALGRFEAELFVHDKTIDLLLFCPTGCSSMYSGMMRDLSKMMRETPYRLGQFRLGELEKPRSLMDVFKSLPYKRVGVDVKI